jgi:hypothetical protein
MYGDTGSAQDSRKVTLVTQRDDDVVELRAGRGH